MSAIWYGTVTKLSPAARFDYVFEGRGYHVFEFPGDVATDCGLPTGLNPRFQDEFVLAPNIEAADSFWNGDSSGIAESSPVYKLGGAPSGTVTLAAYWADGGGAELYGEGGTLGPTYEGQPFGAGVVGDF